MEDRLASSAEERRGGALIALTAIVAITVAWWALALWPLGAAEPDWLARTRAACFGASRGGVPDAGGWILLIGEPLGMLAMLGVLFRRSLRRDLAWLSAHRVLRGFATSIFIVAVVMIVGLAIRASRIREVTTNFAVDANATRQSMDLMAPDVAFIDQAGRRTTFGGFRGQRILLTFAYGHCSTVCPAMVTNLIAARREAGRRDVPIVVVTVDPWRDTPDRLPTLARHWRLERGDRALSASVDDVKRTLDALGIGWRRNEQNGDIEHGATAMIVDERGRIAWRADGGPREIAALVRKL